MNRDKCQRNKENIAQYEGGITLVQHLQEPCKNKRKNLKVKLRILRKELENGVSWKME